MDGFELYDEDNIDRFCRIFYGSNEPEEFLQTILDSVVEKWWGLEMNEREEFRSILQRYIRLYGYISQLITFTDVALEKLYIFGHSLNKKLPKRDHPDPQDVLDSVDLDSFRVQKTHDSLTNCLLKRRIVRSKGIGSDVRTLRDPEQDLLSNIVQALNDAYQTDFTTEE